jgi:hypothetical protein
LLMAKASKQQGAKTEKKAIAQRKKDWEARI